MRDLSKLIDNFVADVGELERGRKQGTDTMIMGIMYRRKEV
jgi:hypothetical protein